MNEWPTCGHKGCWNLAASNRESTRAYGTRPTPVTIYIRGEAVHACSLHLPRLRAWLAMSVEERESLYCGA